MRVNYSHVGVIRIGCPGQVTFEAWPDNQIIQSLEVVQATEIDTASVYPTIME